MTPMTTHALFSDALPRRTCNGAAIRAAMIHAGALVPGATLQPLPIEGHRLRLDRWGRLEAAREIAERRARRLRAEEWA